MLGFLLTVSPIQLHRRQPSMSQTCLPWIKLSSRTTSTSELSGIYYALEHLRRYQPTNWIFTDSTPAVLSLRSSEYKTADPVFSKAILNLNDYLHQQGHTITYQWIPGHTGIHGNETADKTETTGRGSSNLSTIPLSRSDAKFTIKNIDININWSLWNFVDYRSEALFPHNSEVKLKMPRNILRRHLCTIHRHCFGVGFAGRHLHHIGWNASPLCSNCQVVDDISHATP